MSEPINCLENNSELKKLAQNNDLFEKKNYNFERQRDEMDRAMQIFETCSSHVKRMIVVARDNRRNLKEDVEKSQRAVQDFINESTSAVDAAFEKMNLIRSRDHNVELQGNPNLSISLPYDEFTKNIIKEHEDLEQQSEEVARNFADLNKQLETLRTSEEVLAKTVGKAEKEVMTLRAELEKKKEDIAQMQVTSSVNQQKMTEAMKKKSEEEEKKLSTEAEIARDETILKDIQEINEEAKKKFEVFSAKVALTETVYQNLELDDVFNPHLLTEFSDDETIHSLAKQLDELFSAGSDTPLEGVDATESDTIDILTASLQNVQTQKAAVQNDIEQFEFYKNKLDENNEILKNKLEELDQLEKTVKENTEILNTLKVTENSAKPQKRKSLEEEALRLLQATANDIPGPPEFNQDIFTPIRESQKHPIVPQNGKIRNVKRSSIESDSTRPIESNGFPGIQLIDPPPKKTLSYQEEGSDDITQEEDSFSITDESGASHNASLFNQMFSPLENKTVRKEEPVETPNFNFSQHYQKFEDRQEKERAAKKPVNYVDEDDDDIDNSLYAPNQDGADSENNDSSDDLDAPDDILDQSNWGSDD